MEWLACVAAAVPLSPQKLLPACIAKLKCLCSICAALLNSLHPALPHTNCTNNNNNLTKPNPTQHFLKHEAGTAADAASRAPEATASALGTAGEIVAGVAGHVVDKVKRGGGCGGIQEGHMHMSCRPLNLHNHSLCRPSRALQAFYIPNLHLCACLPPHNTPTHPNTPQHTPTPPQAKELGHNITQHGDFMSAEDRVAKSQVGVNERSGIRQRWAHWQRSTHVCICRGLK